MEVNEIYKTKPINQIVKLQGWVRNHRKQKEFGFIVFNDGTHFTPLQIIYDNKLNNFDDIQKIRVGSAVEVVGKLQTIPNSEAEFELHAESVTLIADGGEDYPIQPKKHSREFLREVAHLRSRTNLFQAILRIRSVAAMGVHQYFQSNGYVYAQTPIITANDGEGAGEMFKVTTLDLNNLPKNENGEINFKKDFFNEKVGLTVTGQLEVETYALAFKKAYTFGPTFRAENSNTKTHASEFWMIEPEIAFCDINGLMDIEEDFFKYLIRHVLDQCPLEIAFCDKFVEPGLIERLERLLQQKITRISYEEAIKILKNADVKFETEPKFGEDLTKEFERYLTEVHFKSAVFVHDWPKEIKAFYMRLSDDEKTVAGVDLLVPIGGEIMGGSQREERLDVLTRRMKEVGVPEKGLEWYLDLRKYGGVYHAGFGLGFDRFLMYITGIENIRDVNAFYRTPGSCKF